jgi:imidazolonepropionase-like amidohydrolase
MMRRVAMISALALLSSAAAVADTLALINSRVVDGTGSPPQSDRTILIDDGLIRDVFSVGERSLPSGITVEDVGGRTVLPGLIDGHVHLNRSRVSLQDAKPEDREAALAVLLRSGVTSVRELAGDARLSGELAQRQARGEIQAPRIYYSAVMFGPAFLEDPRVRNPQQDSAPGTAPWSRAVTADSNIAEIITEARATGATGIKLYASLDAPLLNALTAEAHRQGMKAWAHSVTFPASPSEVVAAGVDSLIHSRGLIVEGHADVPDTFKEGIAWIRQLEFMRTDTQAPRFAHLFSEMKRRGIIFEPALYADGDPAKGPTGDWRDEMRVWSCKITNAAHQARVTISAGTDTSAEPGALQRELERLVECGLSPLEAIRAATLNNAKALGIEDSHGTVEAGRAADLLIVNGDPATDISSVSNVHMVVQAGQIIIGPGRLE